MKADQVDYEPDLDMSLTIREREMQNPEDIMLYLYDKALTEQFIKHYDYNLTL